MKRIIAGTLGVATAYLLLASLAMGPPVSQERQQLAEQVFKNVQVMKGIPVNQFMDTMGFFSAALGLNCTGCHVAESLQDWSKFAEDVPRKRMARQMIQMVNGMHKANFGGPRALTC